MKFECEKTLLASAIDGLHTYNRGFGFEVIDVLTADRPAEVRL